MQDLFDVPGDTPRPPPPLADRMRPRCLDEVLGQEHLTDRDASFRKMVERDELRSVIFWGPPGSGKTTIARLLGASGASRFVARSAVTSTMPEVRKLLLEARHSGKGLILFLDEIHRFNKLQQDAFLPFLEEGSVTLLGATTENPAYEINDALLSRCQLVRLEPLGNAAIASLLDRALEDSERGVVGSGYSLTGDALETILAFAAGDARRALGTLEAAVQTFPLRAGGEIERATIQAVIHGPALGHDRAGDKHFDLASALQKSIRGSDPQAAVYYLARLLEAGEPILYVARRLVVCAAEDIGNADPQALTLAMAAQQAAHFLGLPEARIPLSQLAIYLATAPKSNSSIVAYDRAGEVVRQGPPHPVPLWLRNPTTPQSREMGYGAGYVYPHDTPHRHVPVDHLPEAIAGQTFYTPVEMGFEREIAKRMRYWLGLRDESAGP